jgi:hypothetical protein
MNDGAYDRRRRRSHEVGQTRSAIDWSARGSVMSARCGHHHEDRTRLRGHVRTGGTSPRELPRLHERRRRRRRSHEVGHTRSAIDWSARGSVMSARCGHHHEIGPYRAVMSAPVGHHHVSCRCSHERRPVPQEGSALASDRRPHPVVLGCVATRARPGHVRPVRTSPADQSQLRGHVRTGGTSPRESRH